MLGRYAAIIGGNVVRGSIVGRFQGAVLLASKGLFYRVSLDQLIRIGD
jgi:hypothetical protein